MSERKIQSEYINLRISSSLKNAFVKKCEDNGMHYSTVIKEMILNYVNLSQKSNEYNKRKQYLDTTKLL